MSWRMAKCLEVLLAEINKAHPDRSKASDGGIGDAAHASRSSDHNPWVIGPGGIGIVTARDFTNDPEHGFTSDEFAEWLRQRCLSGAETRVKYIISRKRIANGSIQNWAWRAYTGDNPHEKHVHVSVKSDQAHYDNTKSWGYPGVTRTASKEDENMEWGDKLELSAPAAEALTVIDGRPYGAGSKVSVGHLLTVALQAVAEAKGKEVRQ